MRGQVSAVSRNQQHGFSKTNCARIELLAGLGIAGDAHCGPTVRHRSRVAADPTQPNLRQVHLIHAELFAQLHDQGFTVLPGQLGENITTVGLNLLGLPTGTRLHLGSTAVIEITGLRNPCAQINAFQPGLLAAVLEHGEHGNLVRKAGIMAIVLCGGTVQRGDPIQVELPPRPHKPLERV